MAKPNNPVLERLAVAYEVCGAGQLSAPGAKAIVQHLAQHPEAAVLAAIDRCMCECRGRLTLADIIERIDDGRPTSDEAWAQVGTTDEALTILTTTEAMEAKASVRVLLEQDRVRAAIAFRDRYTAIVRQARAEGVPVRWFVSLGHDTAARQAVLAQAVRSGRIGAEEAAGMLGTSPPVRHALFFAALSGQDVPALPAPAEQRPAPEEVEVLIGNLLRAVGPPQAEPATKPDPGPKECLPMRQMGGIQPNTLTIADRQQVKK